VYTTQKCDSTHHALKTVEGECAAAAAAAFSESEAIATKQSVCLVIVLNLKQFQHRIKMQSPQPSGSQSQPETTAAEPKLLDKNADSRQASRAPQENHPFSNS